MRNLKKSRLMTYVVFELLTILVVLIISVALIAGARHQVKNANDLLIFKLNEQMYDYDDPALCMKEALRSIEMIETSSGYEGNVSARLVGNTDDFSLWLDEEITVLFYTEDGKTKVWDLKEYFDKSETDQLIKNMSDENLQEIRLNKVYVKTDDKGEKIPCGIEYQSRSFIAWVMGTESEGELVFDASDGKNRTKGFSLVVLPQSQRLNEFLRDPESETESNVYTNSVMSGGGVFPSGTKYYRYHSDFPDVLYTVAFDVSRIAFEQSKPQMMLAAAYVQTLALYIMIFYSHRKKKKEEARKYRDNFIDAVAHELKTPAAVIQNTSEYLSTGLRPEKQEHYLEVLRNESSHMNDLLNRMLTYTRVKDGSAGITAKEAKLDLLTDEVMSSYADSNVRIVREKGGGTVKCDPELIKSVIDNLISNAVKYGDHDEPVRIVTDGAKLSVWNKAGIKEEDKGKDLWSSMDRIEIKGRGADGSGVGLAISRVILEKHGAAHRAEYKDGGVEFSFDLTPKADKNLKANKAAFVLSVIEMVFFIPLVIFWTVLYMDGGQGSTHQFFLLCSWLLMTVAAFSNIISNYNRFFN